jgi:UDP-N-acetylglucosamine diphosphorylase/glucosamine-1-phosphate N-acetyltransferase
MKKKIQFVLQKSDMLCLQFMPLSLTRDIADFRVGILTIREKWVLYLNNFIDSTHYSNEFSANINIDTQCPNDVHTINVMENIIPDDNLLDNFLSDFCTDNMQFKPKEYVHEPLEIKKITDIFRLNAQCIENDFHNITVGRKTAQLSNTNTVFGANPIFIEEGCDIECATFNTNEGSIYVGKNCKIMEGVNIRGPVAICEGSEIKMGAKIYGGTTIGPFCKIGGEVNNCVFFGYTNKAHDGFIGNSVVGQWCNFGAGTNCSNLKNNYSNVKLWNYATQSFEDTGLQFCGIIMGDHSKCAIGTRFNTGTSVGVCANIFDANFPPKFIESFAWGNQKYDFSKAIITMKKVKQRRNIELTDEDIKMFNDIYNRNF